MGGPWQDDPSWQLVGHLGKELGQDIARLLLGSDAEELKATANAQLAAYTLSVLILDALRARLGISNQAASGLLRQLRSEGRHPPGSAPA